MFQRLEQLAFRWPTSSVEASPVRMLAPLERAQGLLAPAPASGVSISVLSPSSARGSLSSKTSHPVLDVGCLTCGVTCTCWGTEPVPLRFLPSTLVRPTSAAECSCLLPTPSASRYGTSNNGDPGDDRAGYRLKGKASLWTMARQGLLPTPTVCGNYNRKGASANSGDGLATAVGGKLSPQFVEWMMGLPDDWTALDD